MGWVVWVGEGRGAWWLPAGGIRASKALFLVAISVHCFYFLLLLIILDCKILFCHMSHYVRKPVLGMSQHV